MKRGFILGLFFGSILLYFFTSSDVYAANFESSMYGYHVKGVQDGKKLDQRFIFADEDASPVSYRIEGKSSVAPFNGSTYVWRGMAYRNFYNSESDNFSMYSYSYLFNDGPVLDTSENYKYSFNLVQNTSTSSDVVMSNFGNLKVFYRYSIDTVDYSYICTVGDVSGRWGATRNINCVIPGTANTSQYEIFFDFEDSLYQTSAIVDFVVSEKPSYSVTDLLPNLEPTPTPTPSNPNQGVEDAIGSLEGTITDDTVNPDTAGGFFEDFKDNDYGLSDIITLPLNFIKSLTSNTCEPLTLPLPFVNQNLSLPCMSEIYTHYFGAFFSIYQAVTTGLIGYWVAVRIFGLVKGFKDPEDDKIEVMDL